MASLLTNQAAITALQNLNATNRSLQTTQSRVSTGMRVANAADNAAYWGMATTMRSDNLSLSAVKDALGLGASTVDVTMSALKTTNDLVSQIRGKLVTAAQPGVDRVKVQGEIKQLQDQIKSVANASSFSGQNWVSVDSSVATYNATKSIVASFTRSGATIAVKTIDLSTTSIVLYDANGTGSGLIDKDRTDGGSTIKVSTFAIDTLTDSAADLTKLKEYTNVVDKTLTDITQATSTVGSVKNRISTQTVFINDLMDSLTTGIGNLVDADMNEESTRLQALQVQQQLGVQALSIANQSASQITQLFRN